MIFQSVNISQIEFYFLPLHIILNLHVGILGDGGLICSSSHG
jgi:hypothetical protein